MGREEEKKMKEVGTSKQIVWPRGRGRGTRKTQQKGTEENDLFVSTNRKGGTNDL